MARSYAGILGPVAFGVVVIRSLIGGQSAEAALVTAPVALFAFAAIGYVIGFIADRTIVEAVAARFHSQLKAAGAGEGEAMKGANLTRGADPLA